MKHIYTIILFIFTLLGSNIALAQCNLIIDQDFNHWNNRRYTVADAKSDFNNKVKPWTASTYRGIAAPGAASNLIGDVKQETRIVDGTLRAEYTKNDAGGYAGGFLFDPYFDGVEEAYLEYKVKFDENFFWATGGKLPGLGGSTSGINSETSGRGTIPSGCKYNTNGWSARLMWRRNRDQTNTPYLILYSYFAEREDGTMREDGDCGDGKRIFTGLEDDTWYTVRQYIKLNTPGQKNGTVIMWINGVETYRDTKALIRNSGKGNLKINALIMNTYRGGSRTDPVWHSPRDEYAFFDDFKVWTGCSEPPSTENSAPTGSFIEPTNNTLDEGYSSLYVNVEASDPDNDAISLTLKIDGKTIRAEGSAPYEWGHVSANSDLTSETIGLAPGQHLFEVEITDEHGASTTISKTITINRVNKAPEIEIISPFDGDLFYTDDEVIIKVNATDDIDIDRVNFKLDGGYHSQDQTPDETEYSTIYSFAEPGIYVLGARAFDNEGASTEISISIEVQNKIVTGEQMHNSTEFSVYPNPTKGILHLSQATKWQIYSTTGIKINEGTGTEIDISKQPKGLYLLKVDNKIITIIHR